MVNFVEKFGYFIVILEPGIFLELQFGNISKVQVFPQRFADVTFGAFQAFQSFLDFLIASHYADEHFGMSQVIAQVHFGDGGKPDPRVLDASLNQEGDLLQEQFL